MLRVLMIVLPLITGCRGSGEIGAAAVWTAVALTTSAVNRATGGCYSSCPTGTVCNPINGLCELLPCRGECNEEQRCDDSGPIAKCVNKKTQDIVITTDREMEQPEASQKKE